jgi:hypothetical protein
MIESVIERMILGFILAICFLRTALYNHVPRNFLLYADVF